LPPTGFAMHAIFTEMDVEQCTTRK